MEPLSEKSFFFGSDVVLGPQEAKIPMINVRGTNVASIPGGLVQMIKPKIINGFYETEIEVAFQGDNSEEEIKQYLSDVWQVLIL